jgi:nucleoside-diphosphate-sugar epimerase
MLALDTPDEKIRGQLYNLGTDDGNYTKDQIVQLVIKRLPESVMITSTKTARTDTNPFIFIWEQLTFC